MMMQVALPLSVLVGHSGSDLRAGLDLTLEENLYLAAASIAAEADGRLDEENAILTVDFGTPAGSA